MIVDDTKARLQPDSGGATLRKSLKKLHTKKLRPSTSLTINKSLRNPRLSTQQTKKFSKKTAFSKNTYFLTKKHTHFVKIMYVSMKL